MKIRMQSKEEFLETYYQQILDSITLVIHSTTDFESKNHASFILLLSYFPLPALD